MRWLINVFFQYLTRKLLKQKELNAEVGKNYNEKAKKKVFFYVYEFALSTCFPVETQAGRKRTSLHIKIVCFFAKRR